MNLNERICIFILYKYSSLTKQEHIQEVLDKWTQIDDEIWAKVIVFERNRRVAKAYARAPVLTVNGSDDGFDGMRWVASRVKTEIVFFFKVWFDG
jgi:hypothetical protein